MELYVRKHKMIIRQKKDNNKFVQFGLICRTTDNRNLIELAPIFLTKRFQSMDTTYATNDHQHCPMNVLYKFQSLKNKTFYKHLPALTVVLTINKITVMYCNIEFSLKCL